MSIWSSWASAPVVSSRSPVWRAHVPFCAIAIMSPPKTCGEVFVDVCAHRLVLRPQARIESVTAQDICQMVVERVQPPVMGAISGARS